MNLEHTKQRLEQALGITFRIVTLDRWGSQTDSYEEQGTIFYRIGGITDEAVQALAVDAHLLSHSERQLVGMVLELERRNVQQQHKPLPQAADEEGRARELGKWVADRLEEGDTQSPLPDHAALRAFQFNSCLALLLDTEFSETNRFTYKELKRLIDTYFESDNVLIPLSEREWIVLASSAVLEAANEDGELGDSTEELVESIALALHEMIIEWIGECRISSSGLVHAPSNLLSAVHNMRGAIRLGRLFHVEEYVHLPWKLHLERLLYTMDDREKKKFLEQLMKNAEHTTLDSEMLTTLQTFFQNDCNISETSKALYIHRNTLLYRLDKFKQATGMDVRNFHDAVLVHMALLLYKVTK